MPVAAAFSSSSIEDLCTKLDERVRAAENDVGNSSRVGSTPSLATRAPRILGIFTGQGAQWARMGADIISASAVAQDSLKALDIRLSQLPSGDRPSWSLQVELLKGASSSQIDEATLSQPLCTAVQVVLVELLRSAGIKFHAVVGHSSGEIGAAYAAGLISAEDAICIAYYRGLHSALALGSTGQRGAMMAVGTSFEDARELCETDEFKSRVTIAAHNSSTSVTLSGDEDAIEEMKIIFEDEKKFARRLQVNKAYHSHHMAPCSEAYIQSLKALQIKVQPNNNCAWFSSVYGEDIADGRDALKDTYWDNNMTNPVMFMQAVERACSIAGPFDLAIEVGPHPTLKRPTLETIHELFGQPIPFTGLLNRGKNDVNFLSESLGFVWTQLGRGAVDLHAYDQYVSGGAPSKLIKGLPAYSWDHANEFWHESRRARAIRTRSDGVHELLGHLSPDSTDQEMRWLHVLRPKEISWLKGHQLQDQIVFPAAGYVVLALEAAVILSNGASVKLAEVLNLDIRQALVFDHDDFSIETILSVNNIQRHDERSITGSFKYYSTVGKEAETLTLVASGDVQISFGEQSAAALPPRCPQEPNLLHLDAARFYSSLEQIGYNYTGPFRALSNLERKLGAATGLIMNSEESPLIIHPALLDVTFQSVLLAQCFPEDGRLWSLHVPKTIRRVTVNPHLCTFGPSRKGNLRFDSTQSYDQSSEIIGDVDVYPPDSLHAMIQVEELICVPFSRAIAKDDKRLFSTITWEVAAPSVEETTYQGRATPEEHDLAVFLERASYFYLRNLDHNVPRDHGARSDGPLKHLFSFASHAISLVTSGQHLSGKSEWESDTFERIVADSDPFSDSIDLKLLNAVGQNFVGAAQGKTTALEITMRDGLLNQYYEKGLGVKQYTSYLAGIIQQVTHRHPHMNILEIGAGTGGATKRILQAIGHSFATYTYTDISSGFFEKAQDVFVDHLDRMILRVLDISKNPLEQGLVDCSYDMIVASLVLHATPRMEETMKNVRRLLKPGGYVVILELTSNDIIRPGALFGSFPGWWLGADEGRVLSPYITLAEWDLLLRNTGFSGCDTNSLDHDPHVFPMSVLASQAVDERINFLRTPLLSSVELFKSGVVIQDLVLLGGQSLKVSKLIGELGLLLRQWCGSIKPIRCLKDIVDLDISPATTVLSLVEPDEPIFQQLTAAKFNPLKRLLQEVNTILWVTEGRQARNPYANMTVGLVRSVLQELPYLNFQFLDVDDRHGLDARSLAEALLRFKGSTLWQREQSLEELHVTIEPELLFEDGLLKIPRLVPNPA